MLLFALLCAMAMSGKAQDELAQWADTCFAELKAACDRPEANLWGRNLFGPVMLIDVPHRILYANQLDHQGLLHRYDALVDTGRLDPNTEVANTATDWGGVHWATVMFPVNNTTAKRMRLFLHESFHRIQDSLGFPMHSPMCADLDTREGRIWFRLELRALKTALAMPVNERSRPLSDALLFREYRFHIFPGARGNESALEWNEGLAEFTGVYVSGIWKSDPGYLARTVDMDTLHYPSFTRSSAYLTGPLYGILLTQGAPGWQRKITATDNFADLIRNAYGLKATVPDSALAATRAESYDGPAIVAQENAREERHATLAKHYKAALIDGPVLVLHLYNVSVSFDPNNVFSLGDNATVYPGITVHDDWGRLEVTDAAMVSSDWKKLTLPLGDSQARQTGNVLNGPGWTLTLQAGWKLVPGARQDLGDLTLLKE